MAFAGVVLLLLHAAGAVGERVGNAVRGRWRTLVAQRENVRTLR